MPKPLNFAVVGLGMGVHNCKAILDAKGAHLVAVCDTDEERLRPTAERFGCKAYASYAKLLKDPEVDVVNICVESGKHARLGIQAARAGKHLVVEKPVDTTPAKIRKLQDSVDEAGVKAACIFQSRLDPCYVRIKKAVDNGKMGRLLGVHGHLPWFRADSYYQGPHGSWKGTWKLDGGGSLMNQGIHTVDLIQWLAGRVHSVCGFCAVLDHDIETEDMTVAILKFENGALGTLYTTTCSIPEGAQRVYMHGTKGSFSRHGGTLESYDMDTPKQRERMMAAFGPKKTGKAGDAASRDPMAVAIDGHTQIIADLVKAVRDDRDPIITIESATHAVEIACAIFKSSRTGREVTVESIRR